MSKDHVEIRKEGKGYFLTICDPESPNINNTWAVTHEELIELKDKLNNLKSIEQ